jgi:hypothetical protein
MEKKMRKILNPNLISLHEQQKIRRFVRDGLKEYPFKQAMKDALEKAKHHHH